MRRILHIVCSLWLAASLVYGITPKDLVHAFAPHADTVHRQDHPGPVAEAAHHHCGFLSLELMPFDAPYELPVVFSPKLPAQLAFPQPADERAAHTHHALAEGRGPPIG